MIVRRIYRVSYNRENEVPMIQINKPENDDRSESSVKESYDAFEVVLLSAIFWDSDIAE